MTEATARNVSLPGPPAPKSSVSQRHFVETAILAQLLPRSLQSHSCLRTAVEWEGPVHALTGDVTAEEMVPPDAVDIPVFKWAWVLGTIADA